MGSDEANWPRRGTVLAGKFVVGELLGEGGMAIVVAATERPSGRRVALKLPRSERRRPRDLERFEREGRAIAALSSPHLPCVYETGTLPDRELPYLALEYLDGVDLASVLATRTLSASAAAEIGLQVCRALAVAHAAGIVHRDLKPANMFLTASAGRVIVKLLDFGICRTHEPTGATTTGTLLGSPAYMPPERMRPSAVVDTRGDQWSLGIVLYELVAGRRPFDAPAFPDLCLRILLDEVPPLDAPDDFAAVVRRCLAKEPDERFPDVEAIAGALAPIARSIAAAELGIVTPPPPRRRRVGKLAAGAAVPVLLLAVAVALTGSDVPASSSSAAIPIELPPRAVPPPHEPVIEARPPTPTRETPPIVAEPRRSTESRRPASVRAAVPPRERRETIHPVEPATRPAGGAPATPDPLASPF